MSILTVQKKRKKREIFDFSLLFYDKTVFLLGYFAVKLDNFILLTINMPVFFRKCIARIIFHLLKRINEVLTKISDCDILNR